MARFTSLEFMEALGLGYFDYNGAKILLRLLQKKGVAKEVGKISPKGRGRKMVVYEIPEEITISVKPPDTIPSHPPKKKKAMPEEATDETLVESVSDSEISDDVVESVSDVETSEEVSEVVSESRPANANGEDEYNWDELFYSA